MCHTTDTYRAFHLPVKEYCHMSFVRMGEHTHFYEKETSFCNYQPFKHLPRRLLSETYSVCKNKQILEAVAVTVTSSRGEISRSQASKLCLCT